MVAAVGELKAPSDFIESKTTARDEQWGAQRAKCLLALVKEAGQSSALREGVEALGKLHVEGNIARARGGEAQMWSHHFAAACQQLFSLGLGDLGEIELVESQVTLCERER